MSNEYYYFWFVSSESILNFSYFTLCSISGIYFTKNIHLYDNFMEIFCLKKTNTRTL